MPDNEKPVVDQKITATNGAHIENVKQEIHIHPSDTPNGSPFQTSSLPEDIGTSDELTVTRIVATILYYTISLCVWLGCLAAPYYMIKLSLGYYSTIRGQPDASIILLLIPLSIFTIPWIPEKILRTKMSAPLKLIYAWVMAVIIFVLFYVVGTHLGY